MPEDLERLLEDVRRVKQGVADDWKVTPYTDVEPRVPISDGGKTWEPSRKIAGSGTELTDNIVAIPDLQTGAVHFLYQKNYLRVFQIDSSDVCSDRFV